jgi:serine phosphatase RsbU (regulator of sigma subunit)
VVNLALPEDSTLVLYTDGLIERRGISLMESMRWLVGAVEGHADLTADQLAEHIGSGLGAVEDDVALLIVRAER